MFLSVITKNYWYRCCSTLSTKIIALSNNKTDCTIVDCRHSLLGHPVQKPHDIDCIANESLKKSQAIYSNIVNKYNDVSLDPIEIVNLFDELSNTICCVADWADCIATTHSDIAFKEAAVNANSTLQNIVHKLNMDDRLYWILKRCSQSTKDHPIDNQTQMFIDSMLDDFESQGILLCDEKRAQFLNLQHQSDQSSYNYITRCVERTHSINKIVPIQDSISQWKLLQDMLNNRFYTAQCLNYNNYANWIISRSMAKSVTIVEEFLDKVRSTIKNTLQNDLIDRNITLPMDINTFRSTKSVLTSDFNRLKFDFPYFLDFLCEFLQSMYNIRLIVETDQNINDVWDNSIITIKVEELNNKLLGYIYLDPFIREHKSNVACHFTLFGRKIFSNNSNTEQLPRVFLSLAIIDLHNKNSSIQLDFESISEFLHEFGHSLHSILYKGRYQHLSGTRCTTDISEIPSTLMEHFLMNNLFLLNCQNKLDLNQIHRLHNHIQTVKYLSILENTMSAMIDLQLNNISQPYKHHTDVINNIQSIYDSFDDIFQLKNDCNYYPQYFQHFASYGAKYYSYLWSQSCAGLIYKKNLLNNYIFDKKSHLKIQHFLFSQGAILSGRDIMINLCDQNCTNIDDLITGLI